MKQSSTSRQTINFYWQHVRHYPRYLTGVMLSLPLATLVNQYLPALIVANVLNRLSTGDYIKNDVWGSFGGNLALYIAVSFAGTLCWRLVDAFGWRLEANVERDMAQHIYKHLVEQSANFHANSFGGSLVSQTSKILGAYVRMADTLVYQVIPMLWGFVFISVILIGRAPLFVVLFLISAIFLMGISAFITRESRRLSAQHAANESKQTGYLADSVTNVMAIKGFAGSRYEQAEFYKVTSQTRQSLLDLMKAMQVQMLYFSGMTRAIQVLALITGVISVVAFDASIGTVFLVVSYTSLIADQLFTFSNNSMRNFNRGFGDAREMTGILQLEAEVKDPAKPEPSRIKAGAITVKDVVFNHDGANKAIFSGLNLDIKAGEKIGLVGHSGSGKTTFTRLLLRFSDIDDGQILIDGQSIANIKQNDLHRNIAYVPQEPIMFHRSLEDNIRYGDFAASHEQVVKAAKVAHAHDFIKDLPEGYETLVGERGVKLSGGQRQRVAIARAMLKDAPILVLDEATSALDSESEVLIQDALWKLMEGRTAIVVAHRLSTIQKMDRIIVLDNGNIVEQGTHKDLVKQAGVYAGLWAHQSGGFLED